MPVIRLVVALVVIAAAVFARPQAAPITPTQGTRLSVTVTSDNATSDQRRMIGAIEQMIAAGTLRVVGSREDPLTPGHTHQRYQQVYGGLPVVGADVTVQRRQGQVVSIFGVVYDGLAIDVTPRQSAAQVMSTLRVNGFNALAAATAPMLIYPAPDGTVSLVYSVRNDEGKAAYVDAASAMVLLELNEFQSQSAVGTGRGTLGDNKKVSATLRNGTYLSSDALRPPALETFDLRGDSSRLIPIANGVVAPTDADLARSATNVWTDSAVVDAHAHAGLVYDYYFKRFQRRGLDDNNVRIHSFVNPMRAEDYRSTPASLQGLFVNAFYSRACRCMVYGPGLPPGVTATFPAGVRNFASALDVVAHELTHAVTDASSGLIYTNESGALNEAFSDIMGTSVEFFHQSTTSAPADYLMGEDLTPNSARELMRSLQAPRDHAQPDHYWDRLYIGATRFFDSGGVHINSGIANHAFFLAIEGGAHRASGVPVTGVGAANREQVERVFYRAFTSMLPASATFYMARLATLQSARDLYGANGAVVRAITSAWDAVGVVSPGAALTTQFTPSTVPASNAVCGTTRPSFNFRVSVSEFQRVGFTVQAFEVYTFSSGGSLLSQSSFSAATFRSWFSECQAANTRIGAGATACASLCTSLGGRSSGVAAFIFYGQDDNANPGTFISDYVFFGTAPPGGAAENAEGEITYTKAVQQ